MIEKILLRAPRELKEFLKERSIKIGVSLNALILQILWAWVKEEENKRA